jgi:hypothetical protein
MTAKGIGVTCLATLVVSASAMAGLASPALAEIPAWLICFNNQQGAEVWAREMRLTPANGATVPAGTPVTFSGESSYTLTFNLASSQALLSSPDIDSGTGSPSFTSTRATATPGTIYWTASFTFTPVDCESPSTFTTPVRTLIVGPTAAELAADKAGQEEEAVNKKAQEEAAARKKREEEAAATGNVVLDGLTIDVEKSREAAVKLTCSDVETCAGKLTLTADATAGKGKARHPRTESVGTASFSIVAGEGTTAKIMLDNTGCALLSAARGRLNAALTILRIAPLPNETQTQHVRLVERKAAGAKDRR